MATARAKILIDGKELDPYHVFLEQPFDSHHRFSIAVSSEKIEGDYSFSIDNSIASIGKEAEILIDRAGKPGLKFKGIVTSIHIDRSYTADSLIVFEGTSPTYLAEDGRGTRSYAEMDLAAIANELLGAYPGNLFNPKVSPQYAKILPYVVQYRETNYEFLSRMAALYGEWFFYDGQSVIFGELPSPDSIALTLGDDLNSFNYGVNILPSKFKYQSYNYPENRTVENATSGFQPGWLDKYAKKGLEVANKIFPGEPLDAVWHEAQDDAILKHLAEAQKSSLLSNSSFFRGESQHPGITVGSRVEVHVINNIQSNQTRDFLGQFRIVSVTHSLDPNKNYHNSFEAIPLSVTAPPVNAKVSRPVAETQVAVVKENNDPDKLGRIRAQFKWQSGEAMTPWMRILTSHAAGDRGVYFVPEIGDEVLVGFEQANPDRPYMKAAHYHGSAKPEWADPDNNLKAIKTRSGHTILLDDKDGEESITILDKSGNTYFMDTKEKSITITAPETMTLNCKNMKINVEEDMKIEVGRDVKSSTARDINSTIGDNLTAKIGDNADIQVGGDYKKVVSFDYSLAAKNVTLSSEKQMDCSAGTDFSVNSKNNSIVVQDRLKARAKDIEFNASKKFEVNASKEVRQEGGKMELVSKGKMTVKGNATTYVQGAQVKIQG